MSDSGALWDTVDSTAGPAYFDKLPVELIKRIVRLVLQQQDGLGVASHASTERAQVKKKVDIAKGFWPSAYVCGIRELSLVNKLFRELTLPSWYTCVHPACLNDPFFRFHILANPSLCAHVEQLEISVLPPSYSGSPAAHRDVATPEALQQMAWTLPLLPNLRALIVPAARSSPRPFFLHSSSSNDTPDEGDDEEEEEEAEYSEDEYERAWREKEKKTKEESAALRRLAQNAWDGLLSRIDHLSLEADGVEQAATELSCPALSPRLKHLTLDFASPVSAEDVSKLWTNGLSRFTDIEKLAFYVSSPAPVPLPLHSSYNLFHLPSLTTLALDTDSISEGLTDFLERLAPNVRKLTLFSLRPAAEEMRKVHLPQLRDVILNGDAKLAVCLDAFVSSPLETVELEPWETTGGEDTVPFDAYFPSLDLPSSVFLFRLSYTSSTRPSDGEFIAAWAAKGVSASLRWTPSLTPFEPAAAKHGVNSDEQQRAVVEDLRWALDRMEHLGRIGDAAAIQEMAEATRRIRERRILEEQ
ncbi:hypothetical protein JCM8097_001624 [Rhodosporidiobolus ruineniae]